MDNLDDSENNAKVSDSAYSNSCSNSQSRRSHSSKSTHSGSNSSGSSGYGGKQSTSGSSKTLIQLPEKRTKDKDGKKKKQAQAELEQNQTDVEFRLPDPAPVTESVDVLQNASPPPVSDQTQNGVPRSLEVTTKEVAHESLESCSISQTSMQIVPSRGCSEEGFSCVISMHDGVVLYMSSTLISVLGFPKDMWIGRSFIDFVHPLDHNTFASQIRHGLAVPKKLNGTIDTVQTTGLTMSTIFCRIRKYRSLSRGFNVKDRPVSYMPFILKQCLKQVSEDKESIVYLVIQATPVFSSYKTRNEPVDVAIPFVMRHVANGNVEYIDNEAVPLLGYLPQEITNKNILKLYHPEDLPYLRRIYETVVQTGRFSRSKPYRLMAQNGDYLKLETEWSSFINPWSRKLEFVIGKHYVVEGPANPDVFDPPPVPMSPKSVTLAHEDAFEIESLRESIVQILNEVPLRPVDQMKHQMSKRCHDLASFMENLIQDQPKPEDELRIEIQDNDNSYYERDSVMLGGISPHHDYSDSKSSSGVPLSYNQLNYNVNLKRYFDSHQEAIDRDGGNCTDTAWVPFKEHVYTRECMSPMAQYSCDSVEMTSVESACLTCVDDTELSNEYQPKRLTESILNKHDSEMEKIFVKKHRDTRPTKKGEREKYNNETKQKKRDHLVRCNASFVPTPANSVLAEPQTQGLKRPAKHTEAELCKQKHHCPSSRQIRVSPTRENPATPAPQPSVSPTAQPSVSTVTPIWPQTLANGMAPFIPQQIPLVTPVTAVQGFLPLIYVPTTAAAVPRTSEMSTHDTTRNFAQFQAPAVQYMMYGPAVFGTPIMVSPVSQQPTFPKPPTVIQSPCTSAQSNIMLTARNYEEALKPGIKEKPLDKAELAALREEKCAAAAGALSPPVSTRVAATLGIKTSICSATDALIRSNEEVPDTMMSQDSKMKGAETVDRTDESSYSSFYSSFFKTESGSAEESGDSKNKHTIGSTFSGKTNLRNRQQQRRKKEPPWMEQVSVTSELVYKYQVLTKSLEEVLISDRKKLDELEQPPLVNEQLSQLYEDLQLEGVAARLTLEEGITSSESSSEDGDKFAMDTLAKRVKKIRKHSKLVMIYEEEAPLPSPENKSEPEPSTSLA